jgi:hypothetical protein
LPGKSKQPEELSHEKLIRIAPAKVLLSLKAPNCANDSGEEEFRLMFP